MRVVPPAPLRFRTRGRGCPAVSADGDDSVLGRLVAGAAGEPVMALFVLLLLVMAAGFLVVGLVTFL